ncbi:MAG: MFS transporter [Planctomycetaceae bacterium]
MHHDLSTQTPVASAAAITAAPTGTADAPFASTSASELARDDGATRVRYRVIAVSVLMAFILYLDRVCLGEIVKSESFRSDFDAPKERIGNVLGAFFFTYALMQIPAGWASDRFGARKMLPFYIVLWSLMTGLTGWVTTLGGLLIARLACGVAQAGAYPTSGGVIRQWFPVRRRGIASAWVSFGGRLGGTLAPYITTLLILQLGGWRTVLEVYFVLGIVIAVAYYVVVRDRPSLHPHVNEAERALIGVPVDNRRTEVRDILPMLWACVRNRSLWLNSIAQFGVNVGWAFLITWMPTYLVESKGVSPLMGATMVSLVLAVGMPGQLLGGWASDRAVLAFGLRWGRVIPLATPAFIAGFAYLLCPALDSVWLIVACCAVVSMMTDVANPSTWAFIQDVGGRNTSAIYGWANMWGNFGASLSAVMVPKLLRWGEAGGNGQTLVFLACAGAFFVAGTAMLGMDATKLVVPVDTDKS